MDKFKGNYRIPSARAAWHEYDGGAYFVTICTAHKEHFFGEIVNGEMRLTEIGKVANQCWADIPLHFPHVEVPLMVVMPNHIHGIVVIHPAGDRNGRYMNPQGANVETQNFASLQQQAGNQQAAQNKFGPQSKNLASVIRGFKIGVTQYARQNLIPFAWQSRYHDRIIRHQEEMNRIAEYIENNVTKWDLDELNA